MHFRAVCNFECIRLILPGISCILSSPATRGCRCRSYSRHAWPSGFSQEAKFRSSPTTVEAIHRQIAISQDDDLTRRGIRGARKRCFERQMVRDRQFQKITVTRESPQSLSDQARCLPGMQIDDIKRDAFEKAHNTGVHGERVAA